MRNKQFVEQGGIERTAMYMALVGGPLYGVGPPIAGVRTRIEKHGQVTPTQLIMHRYGRRRPVTNIEHAQDIGAWIGHGRRLFCNHEFDLTTSQAQGLIKLLRAAAMSQGSQKAAPQLSVESAGTSQHMGAEFTLGHAQHDDQRIRAPNPIVAGPYAAQLHNPRAKT